MTKEERLLLITDLCGRIPYRPKGVKLNGDFDPTDVMLCGYNGHWVEVFPVNGDYDEIWVEDFRLYLRPMSSMTEEEYEDLCNSCTWLWFKDDLRTVTHADYKCYDWLNAHHFDYRGLIEKGLALEAPEDMYKTE